jgi:hypothetical protein
MRTLALFVIYLLGLRAGAQSVGYKYPACPQGDMLSSDYGVESRHDEFEGTTSYSSAEIWLREPSDGSEYSMKAYSVALKTGGTAYEFLVMYVGREWIFIEKDAPMLLLVDGQKVSLIPSGTPTRDIFSSSGRVFEEHLYRLSAATMAQIARANTVKIRISGDKYIPDFTLPAKGACALGRFVSERIENSK